MTDPRDLLVATAIEDKPDWLPHFAKEARAWRYRTQWDPCPFITAPTWELAGIVLEWAQANFAKSKVAEDFFYNLGFDGLEDYKKETWALALLEVLRDRQTG